MEVALEGLDPPDPEQPLSRRARDLTRELIAANGGGALTVTRRAGGSLTGYVFPDGAPPTLRTSLNARLLEAGAAYPLAHRSQAPADRRLFLELAVGARRRGFGIWALDRSLHGIALSPASLGPNGALVFPKLFRRCVRYLRERAVTPFGSWLASHEDLDDAVHVDGVGRPTRLSRLVLERDGTVRLTRDPLTMTFA